MKKLVQISDIYQRNNDFRKDLNDITDIKKLFRIMTGHSFWQWDIAKAESRLIN